MIRMMGLVNLQAIGAPVGSLTSIEEELSGNQSKLDMDKDGDIEGDDLAKLRAKKDDNSLDEEEYDAMRDKRATGDYSRDKPSKKIYTSRAQRDARSRNADAMIRKADAARSSQQGPQVKNPETGQSILATTAYSAGPTHPAYSAAKSALKKEIAVRKTSLNEDNMDSSNIVDDHEGEMAKAQLMSIHKRSGEVYNMLGDNEQLEGWVQAKLTKASEYLEAVYNNISYEKTKPASLGNGKGTPADATGVEEMNEAAPEGWEGTVKSMKKHKEIDNPWALAYYMKSKGYKTHKKDK